MSANNSYLIKINNHPHILDLSTKIWLYHKITSIKYCFIPTNLYPPTVTKQNEKEIGMVFLYPYNRYCLRFTFVDINTHFSPDEYEYYVLSQDKKFSLDDDIQSLKKAFTKMTIMHAGSDF